MTGTFYGVGVGPGDPELMTLKAVHIIRRSGVIAVPKAAGGDRVALNIAKQAVPLEDKIILELDMPMTKDAALLRSSHETAAGKIIDILKRGEDVVFLTLGDPSVYSTYIYVHRIVRSKGYPAKMIPGVPSFCAVAAKLGDSLADTSQPIHILPGSYGNLREGLSLRGTRVLMKSGKAFPEVKAELASMNLLKSAKMVVNCGMAEEKIVDALDESEDTPGYFTIIVVKENS